MNTNKTTNKIYIPEIHFAPMQGYTDMAYYLAYSKIFPHIDYYYTPFFSVDDDLSGTISNIPAQLFNQIIPQVLPKNIDELKLLLEFVMRNHFSDINLNLGCPYPMVTKRGRGAALIATGGIVAYMIDYIHDNSPLRVSIKTRLGMENEMDVLKLLDSISSKKVDSIIVHPRTAKQLYNGKVLLPMFQKCKELFPHINFIYNGDIIDLQTFSQLNEIIDSQQKWMIGRGMLSNPFLAGDIKGVDFGNENKRKVLLHSFVCQLIETIEYDSNDKGHAFNRVRIQLGYLLNAFPDSQKVKRVIRKSRILNELKLFVDRELG
jgi:tRNA-dihydrouridine synthase